jgi:predicted Zn finger-like uncharacterized protein
MILTCPKCATRYFVDDGPFAGGPREVECDQCGALWTASAEASPQPAAEPDPEPQAPEAGPIEAPGEPATPLFPQPRGRTPKEARRSLWPWSRR